MAASLRAVFPTGTGSSAAASTTVSTTSVVIVAGDVLEVHVAFDTSGSDAAVTLSCKLDPAGSNLSPDGQSAAVHSNGQTAGFEQVFYFKSPPSGTFTVTTTASATSTDLQQKCILLAGTDNGTPTITTNAPSGTGTGTAATVTSPSSVGGIVTFHHVGGQPWSSTSATNFMLANNGGSGAAQAISGSWQAGTGSSLTGTATMSAADWLGSLAMSWSPAGGAPAVGAVAAHWQQKPPGWFSPAVQLGHLPVDMYIAPPPVVGLPFITTVDSSGRFFKDQYGTPIFPIVDHQWDMMGWAGGRNELGTGNGDPVTQGIFTTYAAGVAANGLNAVLVLAITSDQGGPLGPNTNGNTWDGIAPFTGSIGALNSTYWARMDALVTAMAAAGITVYFNVISSYTMASGTALAGITTTNGATYGAALGARYASFPNIVWHFGADYFGTKEAEFAAILTGIRGAGDTHLATCEYMAESNSSEDSSNTATGTFGRSSAMSYRDIYSYNTAYLEIERAYGLSTVPSVLPALYFNGYYDQQPTAWDTVLLDDKLWAFTSGSAGFYYGSEATWSYGTGAWAHIFADKFPTTWIPGFRTFLATIPGWQKLVPDIGSAFITSSRGTKATALTSGGGATPYSGGNTYLTGGVTTDGTLAVLYTPTNRTITIDGTKMVSTYSANWIDPYSFAATAATSSATSYATPGTNSQGDNRWLLVLNGSSLSASGSLTLIGSAGASVVAAGSGNLSLAGTAAAAVTAAATGVLTLSGAGTGTGSIPAAAAGSVSLSGAAAGSAPTAAAGSVTLAGAATGAGVGAASGSLGLSGSSTGSAVATAAGTVALAGAASSGSPAAASGTVALTGTAAATVVAAASGAIALTAATTVAGVAAAAGSIALTGQGTGTAPGGATASGAISLTGSSIGIAAAAASATLALVGSGAGVARAAAAGALLLAGSAPGQDSAAASGALALLGAATAANTVTAAGVLAFAGIAGFVRAAAAASGVLTLAGTGVGTGPGPTTTPTPPERTLFIGAASRVLVVPTTARVLHVPPDERTLEATR